MRNSEQLVAKELLRVARDLTSELFSIGQDGMTKLEDTGVTLEPGAVYAMGASSNPKMIFIMDAGEKFITYRTYPYKKNLRVERLIGENLIQKGSKRWVSTYGSYQPELARSMKSGLKGGRIIKQKLNDFLRYTAYVKPVDGDHTTHWDQAEHYGNVGWDHQDEYIVIDLSGKALKELKRDREFEVIKVVKK